MASAQRGHGVVCALAALVFVLSLSPLQSVRGQTFRTTSMMETTSAGRDTTCWRSVSSGATYSFPDGGYRMETPQNWTNADLGFGRAGSMVTGSNYTDFRIVHDVTDWTDMMDYVFGPIARTTTPGLGTTDGYLIDSQFRRQGLSVTANRWRGAGRYRARHRGRPRDGPR